MSFVESVCDADRWSPSALARHEQGLLERLLTHAHRTVPFYRGRLAPLFERPFGPHLERWEEVPVLTRREVQEHRSALISTAIPPQHGPTIDYSTSGSTGEPVTMTKTSLESIVKDALLYRTGRWWGFDFDATLAFSIRRPSMSPAEITYLPSWGPVFAAMGHSGQRLDINPLLPLDRHFDILVREQPAYQRGYSGRMAELAQRWVEKQESGRFVRAVLCGGEALGDDRRQAIESAWGAPAIARYSSVDAGTIAHQCEHAGGLHVYADTIRVEVVDEQGQPCRAGTSGRVLCTPFHSYAMPLIRYAIGDHATYSPTPCPCARPLPMLQSIEGRERDLIRFPDGTTAWPPLGFTSLLGPRRLRQFQLAYDGAYGIEFRYVADNELSPPERDAITSHLRRRLHGGLALTFTQSAEFAPDHRIKRPTFVRKPTAP